nr:hypothetical protein [Tanacetum cinerariifolium]
MPIPGNLITLDFQGESYYQEYLAKVAKHQRYIAGETGSDPDSPTPKPTKTAKKSNPTAPKPASSLRPVDESVAEGIPKKEHRVDDEEADVQRALEESLKSIYDVQGKGKEKVIEEQVARDLLTLQTPKKKSPADQYIFQRRTSTPTRSSGHDESSSLYVELGLMDSEVESDEDVLRIDAGMKGSLQRLTRSEKPSEADNDKETAETEAESMVSVTIQQDTSSIPPMTTPIIDLTSRPESPKVHQLLKATATETTTTIHPLPSQPQQSTTDSMLMKHIGELKHVMANLIQDNKQFEQRLDSHGARLYTLENLDIPHQPPPPPPAGLSGALGSPGASGSSQVPPPPPPPPSTNQEGQSKGSAAPSSSKTAASAEYQAWMMTDTRLRPSILLTPAYLQMDDDMALDAQAQSFDDEDIRNAHIPKVNLWQDWWKPLEEERPTTLEPGWSISSSDVLVLKNNWASALASTYSPPLEDSPLAQTGDIAMFIDWFYSEYLRYGSKGSRPALSISKIKAAYYPDVGLEQMVPDQMWIEEECKYDIAAMYGISHWWFQRQLFYIDRHTSKGDRRAVRTHMQILSVIIIEVFSMYGYNYMKKIVLR